jgi:hypothetical protein
MTGIHADIIQNETLGTAEGVAGQRFTLSRTPVLHAGVPVELEVGSDEGWQHWTRVDSFADSGPNDRHFLLDGTSGTVSFGTRGPHRGRRRAASTGRSRPRAARSGSAATASAVARGGTWGRAPSVRSSPPSRSSAGWRTFAAPSMAPTANRSTRRSFAARSC